MNKIFFEILLEDYALPGFASGKKGYFGFQEEVENFFRALKNNIQDDTSYIETIKAYDKFLCETHNTERTSVYNRNQLVSKVDCIAKKSFVMPYQIAWTHVNIWGYPYYMSADACSNVFVWICTRNKYMRAVKAKFFNLCYGVNKNEKLPVQTAWGFPCVINISKDHKNKQVVDSQLYVCDKRFTSKEDMKKDIDTFCGYGNFSEFCNDIFADG